MERTSLDEGSILFNIHVRTQLIECLSACLSKHASTLAHVISARRNSSS